MRGLAPVVVLASMAVVVPATAQDAGSKPPYLAWSAAEAERIGKSTRVNGRKEGRVSFPVPAQLCTD
jgi:hypothetical protein